MIYIRLEGDEDKIGLGHFIRMSGLAEEFQIRGEAFRFIIRESSALMYEFKRSAFGFVKIPDKVSVKDEPLWINENLNRNDILIVDYPEADAAYLSKIRDSIFVMLVDNLEAPSLSCNLYLHMGNYASKYREFLKNEGREALLSADYMILRTQFSDSDERRIGTNCDNLLVTMGNSDSLALTEPICEVASGLFDKVNVVVRKSFKTVPNLERFSNVEVHRNVNNMHDLMHEADLGITTGGNTIYEFAAEGLPALVYVIDRMHAEQTRIFHKDGCLISMGHGSNFNPERLRETLTMLKNDSEKRRKMSEVGKKLVDGQGAARVATGLLEYYRQWRA